MQTRKKRIDAFNFSSLVIILLHNNAQPHVARITLQKHINLRYETFLHPPTNIFFKWLNTFFLTPKNILLKREVETAFKDFLPAKPLEFYRIGINNLVNQTVPSEHKLSQLSFEVNLPNPTNTPPKCSLNNNLKTYKR